jgi:hypothetical protein
MLKRVFLLFSMSLMFLTNAVDISHCKGVWPVTFNKDLDHLSLHYDFAADADDLMSTGADRSFLESVYGTQFLIDHVSRVGGTYGKQKNYYASSIAVMDKVWNDVGGAFAAKGGSSQSGVAVAGELKMYKDSILRGGRVFVKEGGQSDFTKLVVQELEKWTKGSGKCVYVTQHSSVNEENYGSGVLAYMKANTVYQKISDGNIELRKTKWRMNGNDLEYYTKQSRQECAWNAIFDEFKKQKSYCPGVSGKVDQSVCVDFSDTHELFWNLQYDTLSNVININEFVKKYLIRVPETEKMKCGGTTTTVTTPLSTVTTALSNVTTVTTTITTKVPTNFKFVIKSGRVVGDGPVYIVQGESFNVQYVVSIDSTYTFVLTDHLGNNILKRVEKINPYYLYGDTSGKINYGSIKVLGVYTIKIKETEDKVVFEVVKVIPKKHNYLN